MCFAHLNAIDKDSGGTVENSWIVGIVLVVPFTIEREFRKIIISGQILQKHRSRSLRFVGSIICTVGMPRRATACMHVRIRWTPTVN